MLSDDQPAEYTTYYYFDNPVRVHFHTENGSAWCVAKDLCNILQLTNASYISSTLKSSQVIKHCINNTKGKQVVTWFDLSAVQLLSSKSKTIQGKSFYAWYVTAPNSNYIQLPKELVTRLFKVTQEIKTALHLN